MAKTVLVTGAGNSFNEDAGLQARRMKGSGDMQYGMCGGPDQAKVAAEAGYDFMEGNVMALLKPLDDEAVFEEALNAHIDAALPYPVANCFVPGDLKVTGPDADMGKLEDYVTTVFTRAAKAHLKVIVFGSGGARNVPEGFDMSRARDQIVEFARMFAPIAAENGVTVALEPLQKADCNIVTTVGEGAGIVRDVGHPAFRLLVDSYHWGRDDDSAEDIVKCGPLFAHVHTATVESRIPPGAEACSHIEPFFRALRESGYNGRISIEGRIAEHHAALMPAHIYMRQLMEE